MSATMRAAAAITAAPANRASVASAAKAAPRLAAFALCRRPCAAAATVKAAAASRASDAAVAPVAPARLSPSPASSAAAAPSAPWTLSAWAALSAAAAAGPAWADEAAVVVPDAAATAADAATSPLNLALAAWPILMYALFNFVIRPNVNPKATFGDFVYLLVFSVIILNLVLGFGFNIRIF